MIWSTLIPNSYSRDWLLQSHETTILLKCFSMNFVAIHLYCFENRTTHRLATKSALTDVLWKLMSFDATWFTTPTGDVQYILDCYIESVGIGVLHMMIFSRPTQGMSRPIMEELLLYLMDILKDHQRKILLTEEEDIRALEQLPAMFLVPCCSRGAEMTSSQIPSTNRSLSTYESMWSWSALTSSSLSKHWCSLNKARHVQM